MTIFLIGAGSGIGAASARLVASMGATAVLADLMAPDALASEIEAGGGKARAVACDMADSEAMAKLIAELDRLDAVVVSAALCPWDDWQDADWDSVMDRVLDVNLKGVIYLCRAACGRMRAEGKGGRVVLVSSLAGRHGGLVAGAHYVASKGGLNAFSKWLAKREAANGITVNVVAPASIETPMMSGQTVDTRNVPMQRMGRAEEVAAPIAFLCSPGAGYITGTVIDVNGGVYMAP
ncbi:SDR family NAD(P)-dependent oxidoreductase [uncultured Marivita sp.]|uniref:SDR family NAD(P)-dependent oxidoreductase n=1 Tax=uncultured Marivita sp. TaxID=888080 RepID=UPI002633C964|nr:SDR family NAD(P)-dependent oxidoreductase [uncultured Marivita sp.]